MKNRKFASTVYTRVGIMLFDDAQYNDQKTSIISGCICRHTTMTSTMHDHRWDQVENVDNTSRTNYICANFKPTRRQKKALRCEIFTMLYIPYFQSE